MNRWPALAEFRSLGVPIIITQLAQMGMGVADAIMAGRVARPTSRESPSAVTCTGR